MPSAKCLYLVHAILCIRCFVSLVNDQPQDMFAEVDGPVNLRLLVVVLLQLVRIANSVLRTLRCACHSSHFPQLNVTILQKHMRVLIQHSQAGSANSAGILRCKGAAQARVLQHEVRIAILVATRDTPIVVHYVQDAVLWPLMSGGTVVALAKEVCFPLFSSCQIQKTGRRIRLKLVAVMRVSLQKLAHFVQSQMNNYRC
mmetsp:Transcript_76789/g.136102  ORF Transcript_76789/g.136102 Transcript_76789/m.136102 type:complete len:200 (-) Transcript_76789:74-673(-)